MPQFGQTQFGTQYTGDKQSDEQNGQFGEGQFGDSQFGSPGTIVDRTEWRVKRNGVIETELYDVEVVDTANPFGNYAIAYIDDDEGDKFSQYTRGTRVDFGVRENSGDTFTHRFAGFVVEARELNDRGSDSLEVECYSFDQFLRRSTVTNNQSGNTISQALEDIIKTDTPVTWDASNVTVGDDQKLTRSYRGERVENVLQSLRSKSENEEFGVNSDIEFFFNPQEVSEAPRDIDNSQWFNYDIPEQGKRALNEVTVYYDGGDKSVTVSDGGDKLDLQSSLGTDDPIGLKEEITREEITNIDAARDEGQKLLEDRSTTLTGTVTTYDLLTAEPGDVLNISIAPRGIDDDFQIAEIQYRWGDASTILTIVEKRGDQDDLLVNLSDTVKRVEMREANRDATGNRITSTNLGGIVTVDGDVDGTGYTAFRYTNTGRNKLRSGWAGNGNLDITEIAVGGDASTPSRSDTSLGNELERVSVSESLPDSKSAEYSGSFTATDVREVGLFTSDGEMVARATIPDTSLSSPVSVSMSLTVSDDDGFENGVLTNAGQTTTRDIIADNSPSLPTQYAYGSDSSKPTVGDTALGNQVVKTGLDEILIQSADTNDGWGEITSFSDSDPIEVANDELALQQSAFVIEGENWDRSDSGAFSSDGKYSGGDAALLSPSNTFIEWDFSTGYPILEGNFELSVIAESNASGNNPELRWYLIPEDGSKTTISTLVEDGNYPHEWANITGDRFGTDDWDGGDVPSGNHTIGVEVVSDDEEYFIDALCVYDGRYNYNFDDTNDGSGGYFDGPELYPDLFTQSFSTASTRRTLQNATAEQTWNDVSNNQFIELSNDGSTFIRTDNSQTATASFGSAETGVDVNVGLSRYGSRTDATPQTGFNGQAIDDHALFADVDALTPSSIGTVVAEAIISPNTITGTTIAEAGQLDSSDNLLTHTRFADYTVTADSRLISSESLVFSNPD